ncbi:MAG: acyl-CoA-binding protein [Nevskiales bacterium]
MELQKEFELIVKKVRSAPNQGEFKPGIEYQLKMYSLYRQAKDGDVLGKRPGMLDMVGRAKYDAWAKLKGTKKEDAMRQYIAEVKTVEKKYG